MSILEAQQLKAYQLKDVISQYLEKNPQKLSYRSKTKKDLIKILKDFNINPRLYQIIQQNPYKPLPRNILKKYGKGFYEYLNAEKKSGLIMDFNFFSPSLKTGFENKSIRLIQYKDYQFSKIH
jgi:hypothetical protein